MGRNIVSIIEREAATAAKASAFSLQSLGMCSSFQAEKLIKRCLTRDTYFSIRGSHDSLMSLKVIYFQSIFLIDFYIKRPIYMQESGINFTKLLSSKKFKRKQKLQ